MKYIAAATATKLWATGTASLGKLRVCMHEIEQHNITIKLSSAGLSDPVRLLGRLTQCKLKA
jgi:hypothetical protein